MPALHTVVVDGPAKTNLTLHVGAPLAQWGGRHALDTVYCALGIYDTITVEEKLPDTGYSLDLSGAFLGDLASTHSDMRNNHAIIALLLMAREAQHSPDVRIRIEKRIPVGAGLGGGSVDAAATMLALNELWDLHWPIDHLQHIAAALGADMPFCITGGYAHGTGYGEQVECLDAQDPRITTLQNVGFDGFAVVGAYQAQLRTPEVYATFDILGSPAGSTNDLQAAAISLHPRSGSAIEIAHDNGATQAFVSGSGPSVVAFAPTLKDAETIRSMWLDAEVVDRTFVTQAGVTPRIEVL